MADLLVSTRRSTPTGESVEIRGISEMKNLCYVFLSPCHTYLPPTSADENQLLSIPPTQIVAIRYSVLK